MIARRPKCRKAWWPLARLLLAGPRLSVHFATNAITDSAHPGPALLVLRSDPSGVTVLLAQPAGAGPAASALTAARPQEQEPTSPLAPLLVWNATSHAGPHTHGCPFAPAMQHSGGADMTVAVHR
jgi:hypothetical protein